MAQSVKNVSKRPPLILPFEALQRCTLITYWKICPSANRSAAPARYTKSWSDTHQIIRNTFELTHGLLLAEDAENQIGFHDEKDDDEHQRDQLVESVQGIRLCGSQRIIPVASPFEGGVESNVSSADEENRRRRQDQAYRKGSSIVEQLEPDGSVEDQYPSCSDYGRNVDRAETLCVAISRVLSRDKQVCCLTLRTAPSSGKPPTVKISQIEMMMYPRRKSCISLRGVSTRRSIAICLSIRTCARRQPSFVPSAIVTVRSPRSRCRRAGWSLWSGG